MMAFEKNDPLPANVRVHPEPHVPWRGEVQCPFPPDDNDVLVRQEGDFLVTYHRPFFVRMGDGLPIYSLAEPVMATWERIEGKAA
jgi:hypothetical protein